MIVVGFADNIMVGRYSTEALASASFVNNVFNVAIFLCIGFTYGLTPLIGALFTQKRDTEIGATLRTGVIMNLIFSASVTLLMFVLYLFVDRLGQPVHLLPLIRPYYLIYLAGVIPISLFNVFAQWSYATKNTVMPTVIILVANLVNVAGNYMLIFGNFGCPEMGLTGAGISTLVARLLCPAAIIVIFMMRKDYRGYRDGFRSERATADRVRRINLTSWPVSLQMAMETGSFSLAAVMAGWLGDIELAAFQILLIVGTLGFCIYYSMGTSVSVLVSNAAGLNDRTGMRRTAWAGYHVILCLAMCSSLVFFVFGHTLMGVFTEDSVLLATAMSLLFPLLLYQLGDATQINFANALRGTSNVMPMLWIAFVSYIVIGIPATYTLGFTAGMGIYGIFLSFSVSLFTAAALFLYYFLRTTRNR